jgi:hypothetical protein
MNVGKYMDVGKNEIAATVGGVITTFERKLLEHIARLGVN